MASASDVIDVGEAFHRNALQFHFRPILRKIVEELRSFVKIDGATEDLKR
jgi:hypothetical protein